MSVLNGSLAPDSGLVDHPLGVALSEPVLSRMMRERAMADAGAACFLGAGVAPHFSPGPLSPIAAGASAGLEANLARLLGFNQLRVGFIDVVDALARVIEGLPGDGDVERRVLLPRALAPRVRAALANRMAGQAVSFREVGFDPETGQMRQRDLRQAAGDLAHAALVLPQPNFFGVIEQTGPLVEWAHRQGAQVIAVSDPLAASLLVPPGDWGADLAVGDIRVLGLDVAWSGPAPAWIAATQVPQTPAPAGDSLARAHACLLRLGFSGLRDLAEQCHLRALEFLHRITTRFGVERRFSAPFFHEFTLKLRAVPPRDCLRAMAAHHVLGGLNLGEDYPDLDTELLVCVTEIHSEADFAAFEEELDRIVAMRT